MVDNPRFDPNMLSKQQTQAFMNQFPNTLKTISIKKYGQRAEAIYIISKQMAEFIKDCFQAFGAKESVPDYSNSDFMLLQWIEVPEQIRRKGIGSQLLDAVKARARRLGVPILLTTELEHDANLIGFYTKNGFVSLTTGFYVWVPGTE